MANSLYPGAFPRWEPKIQGEVVESDHVNKLQYELEATQFTLGLFVNETPQDAKRVWYGSTSAHPVGTPNLFISYDGTSDPLVWPSLHERITNIERAALRDLDQNYVSLLGAGVVDPTRNDFRPPGTGGVAILQSAADAQPALAILDAKRWSSDKNWSASSAVALWSSGAITAQSVVLDSEHTISLDSKTGIVRVGHEILLSPGSLGVGGSSFTVGTAAPVLSLVIGTDETIYLNNALIKGRARNVFRIADASDSTVFLIDSEGNVTCKSINGDTLDRPIEFDGLTLDKNGLVFHAGGEYRPNGLVFKDGGGLSPTTLTLEGGSITSKNKNLVVDTALAEFSGGMIARGMKTWLYNVGGTMFIPVPPYNPGGHTAAAEGRYASPSDRENSNVNYRRKIVMDFVGPATGAVEIQLSVEIRSFSRPTWVSYEIFEKATPTNVILAANDRHGCVNNGARAVAEQTDVDQVRSANFHVVGGLTPGREYQLRVVCRAADPGYSERNLRWIQASGCRVIIKPLMTSLVTGEIAT